MGHRIEKGYAVKDVRLFTKSGRPIRVASRVYFPDGKYLQLDEKVSKGLAIRTAKKARSIHPEYIKFGK